MPNPGTWNRVVVDAAAGRPAPGLLRSLAHGETAVVVVRGLLPESVFRENLARLGKLFANASTTRYANGSLTTIGPYLNKYLDDLDGYFAEGTRSATLLEAADFDLGGRVAAALADAFDLTSSVPARQPDGRTYPTPIVRIHADGVRNPLHNDNIMRDAAGTDCVLSGLTYQLSCIVCLQECDRGGELRMYRKAWEPSDEQHKIPGHLGYEETVVAGHPCHEYKPQAGDVYLINPTHYHSIERVSGADRLTMGFFMGFADESMDSAVLWG